MAAAYLAYLEEGDPHDFHYQVYCLWVLSNLLLSPSPGVLSLIKTKTHTDAFNFFLGGIRGGMYGECGDRPSVVRAIGG
jgi:hypothetical protein